MVKWCKVVPAILFLFLLILSGCDSPSWATAGEILSPVYVTCPLEGKWTVVEELDKSSDYEETDSQEVGGSAQFTGGVALFDGYVWNQPSYKMKRVNSTDYLMTKYLNLSGSIVPHDQEVEVVTVYAASNFWGEFMIIDAGHMVSFVQDKALLLQKVSDQVDASLANGKTNDYEVSPDSNTGISGVLIGLKIPSDEGMEYQTLWIAAENKKLHPILTRKDIFFPRNSGFWELKVDEGLGENGEGRFFSAHDVSIKLQEAQETEQKKNGETTMNLLQTGTSVINYVGNDYVAIETAKGAGKLQVLPVDNLSSAISIKLSDLMGDKGTSAYDSAKEQAVRTLRSQGAAWLDENGSEENFGLVRKNGHWYLTGSISYQKEDFALATMEFTINLIPPADLIFFDTLYLSWQNITDRVPDAVDAFTSPNKDIALIRTKSKLYIYGMTAEQLDSRPLAEIKMEEGVSIIMAEWATSSYVNNWEKAFLYNSGKRIE